MAVTINTNPAHPLTVMLVVTGRPERRRPSFKALSFEALRLGRGVQDAIGFGSQARTVLGWQFHGLTGATD
jgi:hypothetical protein